MSNKYIGVNHTADGIILGGVESSFNGIFKNEEVLIEGGFDYIPCVIGDIKDAYNILERQIKEKSPQDFESLCSIILDTNQEYFGDYNHISERMDNYKDLDEIETKEDIGKVSDLKGKNAAMCVERAMLSQNLLKSVGINSVYKCSGIKKDKKSEIHSYNLVEHNDKYYIFDATIPTLNNGVMSPLITEIPKEVFEKMISPSYRIGYSIEVTHYNPLRNVDVEITYDAGRKDTYYPINSSSNKKI